MRLDEEIPYRSAVPQSIVAQDKPTIDEHQYGTLKSVHNTLSTAVAELDSWHAFDLEETELKLKQQIVAHRLAFDIIAPLLSTVENALAVVDDKFKQRQS